VTDDADGPDEGSKAPRNAFKRIAAAVSVMAGVVPIVGAFEHWFDSSGGTQAEPASTVSEYAAVCNLSNGRQREEEHDRARFREAFAHARDTTAARDAMLLLAKQKIASTSELQNRIQALNPPSGKASTQHSLEADWNVNLTVLGEYRERLGEGVSSAATLVKIAAALPRWSIEARSSDARGRLLRLGPACSLQARREQPTADWSPTLRRELTAKGRGETAKAPIANFNPHGGGTGAQPEPAPNEALPDAELPTHRPSEALPETEGPAEEAFPDAESEAPHHHPGGGLSRPSTGRGIASSHSE
jgi:hypothetical protein